MGCLNLIGRLLIFVIFGVTLTFNIFSIPNLNEDLLDLFFDGNTMDSASSDYEYQLMPPLFFFQMWGPIYTMVLIWQIMSVCFSFKSPTVTFNNNILTWFTISCAFNLCFLFLFNYGYKLLALCSVITLNLVLQIITTSIARNSEKRELTGCDKFGYNALLIYGSFVNFTSIMNIMMNLNYSVDFLHDNPYYLYVLQFLFLLISFSTNVYLSHKYEIRARYDVMSNFVNLLGISGLLIRLFDMNTDTGVYVSIAFAFLALLGHIIIIGDQIHCSIKFRKQSKAKIEPEVMPRTSKDSIETSSKTALV